jgi:hypothetical protein
MFTPEMGYALTYVTVRGIEVVQHYGDWRDVFTAAETQYVRDFGELPEWAIVIEKWELVGEDAYIWVHRDWVDTQ